MSLWDWFRQRCDCCHRSVKGLKWPERWESVAGGFICRDCYENLCVRTDGKWIHSFVKYREAVGGD